MVTTEELLRPQKPPRQRARAVVVVGFARILCRFKPIHIEAFLTWARGRTRPATQEEASAAIDSVVSVSTACAGQGCVLRSVSAALMCRMNGTWATWCVGTRMSPFAAHAWLEVDGAPVREPFPAGYLAKLIEVPASSHS